MQAFVPLIYDAVTIGIFLYMIAACAHRGFVRTVVSFIGYAAALLGSALLAKPLAQSVYASLVRPKVEGAITEKLDALHLDSVSGNLLEIVEQIPSNLLALIGMDKEEVASSLEELITGGGNVAGEITDTIVGPLVILLLKLIFFLAIFTVAMFLVRKLCAVFAGVNRLPLIGPVNQILGGLVGALQAALTLYVLVVAINLVLSFTGGALVLSPQGREPLVLASNDLFERTLFFKAFVHMNPVNLLLLKVPMQG